MNKVVEIWKKAYSEAIKDKKSYQATEQLRQIASYFSPGKTFYYILNFHNMRIEYISDEVEEITGFSKDKVTMDNLLSNTLDLAVIQKKKMWSRISR